MKRFHRFIGLLTIVVILSACHAPEVRNFNNPILPGFYPDPSLCKVGDDFYLVNSSFEYFPGVPVHHSKDLVHWKLIGYCLTRESQLPLENMRASGGIYAPTIRYHDGTFYMITTNVDGGGNFYVTARDPAGPWSEPVWIDPEGIDPSLMFDDDGSVYMVRQAGGARGYIQQRAFNLQTGQLEGPAKNLWNGTGGVWPEGPHMYKINGTYYLLISEGGTSYDHMVTVARCDSPWGPFESNPDNPIITHRHLNENPIQAIGHADIVETSDGWWMVCLGIRPQGGRFHHMGRETFLVPLAFDEDGWPVVNDSNPIALEMKAPNLKEHLWDPTPGKINFDEQSLDLHWNYLRNPDMSNYSLSERRGFLRLKGSEINLSDQDSPTFVGRRQTDLTCKVSTSLDFNPKYENEEAGLVIRQNDRFHYEIGLTIKDSTRAVFLRKVVDAQIIEDVKYIEIANGPVTLTVNAAPLTYEFVCMDSNGRKVTLGTGVTKDLSVERIGFDYGMCFTGTYFGLYATGNGKSCSVPADFDWFDYH